MSRTYNTMTKGRDRIATARKHLLEPGTVLYKVSLPDEDVWHTNAESALAMWERHEDEASLWQRVNGRESRVR